MVLEEVDFMDLFRYLIKMLFVNCRAKIYSEPHIARAGSSIAIQRRKCFN